VEPVGRDTAACLGFSAIHLERRDPDGIMVALPADHYIADSGSFRQTLQQGLDSLPGATAVVFGITPVRPDTGYGYVQAEKPALPVAAWPVLRFVEKPDPATAEVYLRSGGFFWNSGIFIWSNRTLLELFRKYMPDTYGALDRLRGLTRPSDSEERRRVFSGLRRISIDFGIIEKTGGLRLVPADFGWDDIGNWASLARALPVDSSGNASTGARLLFDSSDCITYSDAGRVAVFGVSGLVVVQAHGQVLVCPRERAADLKRLVTALAAEKTPD
jgi:mannose-1-phosphate guanylyltransferase